MTSRRRFLAGAVAAVGLLAGCAGAPSRTAQTPTDTTPDRPGSAHPRRTEQMRDGSGSAHPQRTEQMGDGSGSMGPGSGPGRDSAQPAGPMGPASSGPNGTTPTEATDPSLAAWFSDVPNYRGVMDLTGTDEVRIQVGVGDGLRFGPAAVRVSPGTRVVWTWTGRGGSHNVVDVDGGFESPYHADAGATFEHVFADPGTFRYRCAPHATLGMKGAVVVSEA